MLLKQQLGAQASRSVEEQAEIFIGLEPAETDAMRNRRRLSFV